ncbi:Bug family tripartite tricarboxylate transporter substrate binding protein [Paraburkholderia sp. ZP32-5]|uniref:Bug family tripartite tricarboxylate transporter substrate binding protein n=1 Tax=Paraburkholderia sp. ZP32-5 TaxID=2883245 RepID=UPI001F2099D2|nr:tripartite tricarboxylate transporter substrate binding protein [Paraburkholderia sp. ZP32-5]
MIRAPVALAAFVCCALTVGHAYAADRFPEKPIHIVVGTVPGGTVDIIARLLAKGLTAELGQPVIVDNRPGVDALIGARYVMHAKPDGYTLLAVANTVVSAPSFLPDAGYDPIKDFMPVTETCEIPMVLVAGPALKETSVPALIARAKAHPGEVTVASVGVGSIGNVAATLFSQQAGVKLANIPYKGSGQAMTDVLGGQVMMIFDQVSTSGPYVKSGKVRGLAVTTATRSPLLPDVPTLSEAGLRGYQHTTFNGILAPAGTPSSVVGVLHDAIAHVMTTAANEALLEKQGIEVKISASPQAFGDYLREYAQVYRKLAASQAN